MHILQKGCMIARLQGRVWDCGSLWARTTRNDDEDKDRQTDTKPNVLDPRVFKCSMIGGRERRATVAGSGAKCNKQWTPFRSRGPSLYRDAGFWTLLDGLHRILIVIFLLVLLVRFGATCRMEGDTSSSSDIEITKWDTSGCVGRFLVGPSHCTASAAFELQRY